MIFPVTKEVRILPDTPQHWNCEFFLETLTFLLCFNPSPLEACLPLRYPCPCQERKIHTYQGKGLLSLAQQTRLKAAYCLPLHRTCFPWPSYLSPVHQLFPCTGNLRLCRNLFPYLPIHICNMPRYLNVSSGSQIPFLLQLVYDKSC